jgi:hypothetical protein
MIIGVIKSRRVRWTVLVEGVGEKQMLTVFVWGMLK